MLYAILVGTGVVTTAYGPFKAKADAVAWAHAAGEEFFCVIVLYPPSVVGEGN